MTHIRVDVSLLREKADQIAAAADKLRTLAEQTLRAAEDAPSYDGQFGPQVRTMGEELHAELVSKADHLRTLSEGLRGRADAFEAADREWDAAMDRIYRQTWPSLSQIQWGTPGQEPPWWLVELIIGMFPFGDAYDILKELFRLITQGETDELILILALIGLVADIGWADGIVPDPADAANAGLALLKGLVRQVPPGPARDAIKEALLRVVRNADEAPQFFAALHQLIRQEEVLTVLKNNPRALAAVLDAGPETMELLAKNGDVVLELLKHGDDAAPFLKNADVLDVLVRHGPEAVDKLISYGDEGLELIADHGKPMAEFLIRTPDEAGDLAARTTEALEAAGRLGEVEMNSSAAGELVQSIAKNSVHGSGDRVVLGEWVDPSNWAGPGRGYIQEAIENGGKYYETPPGLYEALGRNRELAWMANERFLVDQLEEGVKRIDFVGDVQAAYRSVPRTSFRWRELDYLFEHAAEYGYELVGNAWVNVP